jgi:hypothetical protein
VRGLRLLRWRLASVEPTTRKSEPSGSLSRNCRSAVSGKPSAGREPPGPPPLLPEAPDFALIAVLLLFALVIAIFAALRLTKRILVPLNSLAEGARSIAARDPTARAPATDRSAKRLDWWTTSTRWRDA